jgi:hypothetical protein
MYKKLEALGSSLLERLVPKAEASAACNYKAKYFDSCWQCHGFPCIALCADGCGCKPDPGCIY